MKTVYIISVVAFFILAFNSCNEEPMDIELYTFKYEFSNQTEYLISMKVFGGEQFFAEYKLNPFMDSVCITGKAPVYAVGIPLPFNYLNKYNHYEQADSIYLEFSNKRFITYSNGDSIFLYQSYKKTELGDTIVIYKYCFTNEDYINAALIE